SWRSRSRSEAGSAKGVGSRPGIGSFVGSFVGRLVGSFFESSPRAPGGRPALGGRRAPGAHSVVARRTQRRRRAHTASSPGAHSVVAGRTPRGRGPPGAG